MKIGSDTIKLVPPGPPPPRPPSASQRQAPSDQVPQSGAAESRPRPPAPDRAAQTVPEPRVQTRSVDVRV